MSPKSWPHPVDIHVGARIRLYRNLRGLSQGDLARALSLTFQQIQKYERGANRISASMLYAAAHFLELSTTAFFEGPPDPRDEGGDVDGEHAAMIGAFLVSGEGLELAALVPRLPARQRRAVLALISALADADDQTADVA